MSVRVCLLLAAALVAAAFPARAQSTARALHMRLLAHVEMNSGGEGMAEVRTASGRRILYVAHEAPPKCFMVLDVTDAAAPQTIEDVDAPLPNLNCNSLDAAGNVLVVAAESPKEGEPGGGIRVWSLRDPLHPKLVSYFDLTGPYSRGTHHVWLESPTRAWLATGAADFRAKRARKDGRFVMAVDLGDPAHPKELGRWWYPGQRVGDPEPAPGAIPQGDKSPQNVQPHNIDVFPSHPERAYVGYVDGGVRIFDAGDPLHVVEAAYYVPAPSPAFTKGQVQINDVFVDDRGVIFGCDRFNGGIFVLRSDLLPSQER